MKKTFLCLIAFVLVFSIVSCNSMENQDGTSDFAEDDFNTSVVTPDSAYNIAKDLGFEGTLDEFIELISGRDGTDGKNGVDGIGIISVSINQMGNLIVVLSNGSSIDCGKVTGNDGKTPTILISSDGYWIINGVKTEHKAIGEDGATGQDGKPGVDGKTPTIEISSDGYWIINGVKTEYKAIGEDGATGQDGKPGVDGKTPTIEISSDGYWIINGVKTEHKAIGEDGAIGQDGKPGVDGKTPTIEISSDGYWIINGVKTDHKAIGEDGATGQDGKPGVDGQTPSIEISDDGYWIINGIKTEYRADEDAWCSHNYIDVGIIGSACEEHSVLKSCFNCGKLAVVEENPTKAHNYFNEMCSMCGDTLYSDGLELSLSYDGTYYEVVGIGSCTDMELILPSTYNGLPVKTIAWRAFFYSDITNVTVPNSITAIESYAFSDCYALASVTVGADVTYISDNAFDNCNALVGITVNKQNEYFVSIDGNLYTKNTETLIKYATGKNDDIFVVPDNVTCIASNAFSGCNALTCVILPESLTTLSYHSFSNCDMLTTVTIPANVSSYYESFSECDKLESIYVDEDNEHFASIDGNLYTKDGKTLLQYAIGKKDATFVIPDGVTTIESNAFRECKTLVSITIPASVTEIKSLFYRCTNLENITVDENNEYFSSIDGILYDKNVNRLIKYPLAKTSHFFYIPETVTIINEHAFAWAKGLYGVEIHENVTEVGVCAFVSTNMYIGVDSNNQYYKSIGGNLYSKDGKTLIQYTGSLTSFTVPSEVTVIDLAAFADNDKLQTVIINNDVQIKESSFRWCDNLTAIVLPLNTEIQWLAFEGSFSLTAIYYAGGVEDTDSLIIDDSYNDPLLRATTYYYSEEEPTTDGNFWHYVDGVPTAW